MRAFYSTGLGLLVLAGQAAAQEAVPPEVKPAFPQRAVAKANSIPPPFGRSWEDDAALLEKLLTSARAKVSSREKTSDGEVWTVDGLQQGLTTTQFRFAGDKLAEVVLSYHKAEWSEQALAEFASKVRERIELRYGVPEAHEGAQGAVLREDFWTKAGNGLQVIHRRAEPEKTSGTLQVRYLKDGRQRVR